MREQVLKEWSNLKIKFNQLSSWSKTFPNQQPWQVQSGINTLQTNYNSANEFKTLVSWITNKLIYLPVHSGQYESSQNHLDYLISYEFQEKLRIIKEEIISKSKEFDKHRDLFLLQLLLNLCINMYTELIERWKKEKGGKLYQW